jgi:diguanylate cyclase (GGDEF)-like protein
MRRSRLFDRAVDRLLTTDPVQRMRLAQAGLAMLLMAVGVLAMQYFVLVGVAPALAVNLWTAASLGGMAVFYALIRSGWSRRLPDPSLTLPQMLYAIVSGAVAYALVGDGRGGVFPIVMVVIAFGLFRLRPREVSAVGLFAVAIFGLVMALMAWQRPEVYVPRVEFGHFLMLATMLPAMALLAARFSDLRQRLRRQKQDLSQAVARIQELATHDELTGLVNRRHMQALMEQEHRRCARSGQCFCVAVLDVDHFKAVNDSHGHAAGDAVLVAVAARLRAALRPADLFARIGGEEFLVALPDTAPGPGLAVAEALRRAVVSSPVLLPEGAGAVAVTVSIGMAWLGGEARAAGDAGARALQRADDALLTAKRRGRNQVVPGLAPA